VPGAGTDAAEPIRKWYSSGERHWVARGLNSPHKTPGWPQKYLTIPKSGGYCSSGPGKPETFLKLSLAFERRAVPHDRPMSPST